MRGYLSARYDCSKVFSAQGEGRNQLVLMMAIDIAIYHIFSIHNPRNMSQIRVDRYERAIEWLKGVRKGDISVDGLPEIEKEEDRSAAPNSRFAAIRNEITISDMASSKKSKRITAGGNIGQTPTQTIVLQPTRRGGLDVSAYMEAIRKAELIDFPRRVKLIDLYKDVMIDTHLFAVRRKQKAAILSTPIQFVRNGEPDERMQDYIDSPWFGRFIEDLIDDEWEGVGGSLFQFFRDKNGWIDYELIPRKHVDPINRTILRNQTDLIGTSWDEFSDLLYIGNPRQIGSLVVPAFWVILKRNNVADWAELGEIFGRPIREGTYDAWDNAAREKLVEDIAKMGGAGVIIHPEGTKINLIQPSSVSSSGDLYEKFSTFCNNEISKAVNGNTLTTEPGDKGTQSPRETVPAGGRGRHRILYQTANPQHPKL